MTYTPQNIFVSGSPLNLCNKFKTLISASNFRVVTEPNEADIMVLLQGHNKLCGIQEIINLLRPNIRRLVIASVGHDRKDIQKLASTISANSEISVNAIGAEVVYGIGCRQLNNSDFSKAIEACFKGTSFELQYDSNSVYAYIDDFMRSVIDELYKPVAVKTSYQCVGQSYEVDEILEALELVFPYNGISAAAGTISQKVFPDKPLQVSVYDGVVLTLEAMQNSTKEDPIALKFG